MRATILQHEEDVPPGHAGGWLTARGHDVTIARAWERGTDPIALDGTELLVVMGSRSAAYDDSVPWLAGELELIRDAAAKDVPTLGICFGSQAVARALGGSAAKAQVSERGWMEVFSDDPDLVAPGPWLSWHDDTFVAPPGAESIARTADNPHAFVFGRAAAVQFHPEVDQAILTGWLDGFHGARLAERGVDRELVRRQGAEREPSGQADAYALFDALLARVTR